MWITAWILVASGALYQPTYPPFYSREDCESARLVFTRNRADSASQCIQVRVFTHAQR